jgi:hypothetical protein
MRTYISISIIILLLSSCRKDCLEKGKCEPNNYISTYLIEQTTPVANGTVYYIDSENGKKKNSGTSTDDAFESIKQLKDITFNAGDQILFKRAQIHFGEFELKQSGTATDRIYIAAYGTGDIPVVKSEDGSNLKSTTRTIFLNQANYVTIQNLNIHGGEQAILLSNANYTIIEGCRIGEKSASGLRATGEYSDGTGSNNGIVHNCLIYSGESGNIGDRQSTDGIQLMDGASNWHIHNNEFKAWSHSAMSIKQLYSLKENNNNIIDHNLFDCGDIDYMRALDITGGDHKVENNVFQQNIIRDQTVTSHLHGNSNTVAYNLFLGLKSSDESTQPWALDFHVITTSSGTVDKDKMVCYDNKIYNNVIYNFSGGVGVRILNAKNGANNIVHDNEIVNNIFYNVTNPIDLDSEPTGTKISNNIFYIPSSSPQFKHNYLSYSLTNFEALNANIINNIDGNPMFINTSSEDFNLTAGSPAIDNGINVNYVLDYNGNSVNGNPDIGAFEY